MEQFPYEYLIQAYNILTGQGHEAFRRFVNRIKMPTEDIERVLGKHAYQTSPEFRKEVDEKINKIKRMFDGTDFELSSKNDTR